MSQHSHIAKAEQAKSTNSGFAINEVSDSSQSSNYRIGPGEMAVTSLQSAADQGARTNGVAQLQNKASQSSNILKLQAKADGMTNRQAEPIQNQGSINPTTQVEGEISSTGEQELELGGDAMGAHMVQLVKTSLPRAIPNKISGPDEVAQLVKEKSRPLGGMLGGIKRALGLKPPKEAVPNQEEVQAKDPKKEEGLAVQTPAPATSEEIKEKVNLSSIKSGNKVIEEKINQFNSHLSVYTLRKGQFDLINESKGNWEGLVKEKEEITKLKNRFVNEQKKIPPGRKRLILNKEFNALLTKDFSTSWEKEYEIVEDTLLTTTGVEKSTYWLISQKINSNLDLFASELQASNEFFARENTNDYARLSRAQEDKKTFENRLERLELIKGKLQPLEVEVDDSLAKLDSNLKEMKKAPPLSLENLKRDFEKLQIFIKEDYSNWKKEKEEIDALIAKKKRWFNSTLTDNESKLLDKYLADNSYLSAESTQENRIELKDILKSLSKPNSDQENLTTDSKTETEASAKTNSVETEKGKVQSDSGSDETGKLHSDEEIKASKDKLLWGTRFFRTTDEEKDNKKILDEKKLKIQYERVGYVEKLDLKPAKNFIEKTPEILAKLDWANLNDPNKFEELVATEDKTALDQANSEVKGITEKFKAPSALAQNAQKGKEGLENIEGPKDKETSSDITSGVVTSGVEAGISEATGVNVDIKAVESVISDGLVGVLSSIEGILKLKDMISGTAKVDGKNVSKATGGIVKLAIAGLKITSTVDHSITTNVLSIIPFCGVVNKTLKVAETFFSRSLAAHSEETMKAYIKESYPPNLDNVLVFINKDKKVLKTSSVYKQVSPAFYKAAKEALKDYETDRRDSSIGPIATLNKDFKLEEKIGFGEKELDLENYLSELETYSLMAKLEEINHTKTVHSGYDLVKEGLYLSGQVANLIPGGQIAAGALTLAGATMGISKEVGLAFNKYHTGDSNGIFGTGKYGKEKHAVYVMHAKKIIEMYSTNAADLIVQKQDVEQAKEKDDKIEQNLGVLEKIVYATGNFPPDVYKSAEGNKKGYKTVGKLVKGMKQR